VTHGPKCDQDEGRKDQSQEQIADIRSFKDHDFICFYGTEEQERQDSFYLGPHRITIMEW